jgi:hypothetical protein
VIATSKLPGADTWCINKLTFEHICQLQVLVSMQRQRQARLNVKQAPDRGSKKAGSTLNI